MSIYPKIYPSIVGGIEIYHTGKWSTVMRTRKFVNLEFYSVLFKGSREGVICGLWPIYWSIRRVLFNVLRCLKRGLIIAIHKRERNDG